MKTLQDVVDPEVGISIVDMELIDEVNIEGDSVSVNYHLTAPFCPPVFALMIGRDIKEKVSKMSGVNKVQVKLTGHMMADDINKQLEAK